METEKKKLLGTYPATAMTVREYFAALAMQGLAPVENAKDAAKFAVECADALIAALNEK